MISSARQIARKAAKVAAFAAMGNGPRLRRRLDAIRNSGSTVILNLHRVADDDGSDYKPLAPALFEELLTFVKREFAVVTIGELGESCAKPKLVLSFDDGYRDFFTTAVPILRKHGLRANQNIIPRCVDTGLPPLNVIAQDFVGQAPKRIVDELRIEGFAAPRDRRFGHRLSHFLKFRPQAEQDRLAADLMPQFRRWDAFKTTPMMSAQELRGLEGVEIGAHSFAHSSMEFETDDFLDADIDRCRDWLRDQLGIPMTIYAFPNGSCAPGQAERVRSRGVDHVLLVGESFDRDANIHHRFTFDGRSPSEVRFKALGGLCAV